MKRAVLLAMVAATLTIGSGPAYADLNHKNWAAVHHGAAGVAEPPSPCVVSGLQLLRLLLVLPIA